MALGQVIPTGTVTFLFSDVVGSTRAWAADPPRMSVALRKHDTVCRGAIEDHGGHVFSVAGDSFGAAFQRAGSAVACAQQVQAELAGTDWGDGPTILVRVGLHLGEAEERDGNYFGPVVNEAARVMAVAHGGQILLTRAVREAAGVSAVDLGTHTLRDVDAPVDLWQLGRDGFPPLAGRTAASVSLPSPRTSLVGRDGAVDEVRALLGRHRPVTLTGAGGCGKTRIAIEVAHREVAGAPDDVWFVDLVTVTDDAGVVGELAATLGISAESGADPLDAVADVLAGRDALLVIDNCEHVVDAAAETVDRLLERCPRLRILTTSRESLDCDGEFAWRVPPLGTATGAPATQLFVERALAAGAELPRGPEADALVAEIVDALDGLPLAIELAAARTRSLDLAELLRRLDDRFRLLGTTGRRRRPRQATLEAAVQWSYDLLTPEEQSFLQVLSVFQGGFDGPGVVGVTGFPEAEVADRIDALVARSLVDVRRDGSGVSRHRLLETIRLFAATRLAESGDEDTVRDRHLDHFRHDPVGASLDRWLAMDSVLHCAREYENFRAAAQWAVARGRPADAARIAAVVTEAGTNRGEVGQVLEWLQLPGDLPPADRLVVDTMLGWERLHRGDLDGAATATARALALAADTGSDFGVYARFTESTRLGIVGDLIGMVEGFLTAREVAHAQHGPNVCGLSDFYLGWLAGLTFRYEDALAQFDFALAEAPDGAYRHIIEANRAWALLCLGRVEDAARAVDEFAPVPAGSQWAHLNLVFARMVLAHTDGPEVAARSLTVAARPLVARRPEVRAFVLSGFAYLAQQRGDEDRAQDLAASIVAPDGEQIWNHVVLRPLGATADTFVAAREEYEGRHPVAARAERQAATGARLLEEEFARWS